MFNATWIYTGVLYAIAIACARRWIPAVRDALPLRVAAFFYALVLIYLFRPMTGRYVNVPVDFINILPPWGNWNQRRLLSNPEMNDLAMQIVPWAHQAREAWRSLHFPIWNALAGCGYPLLANGQSSAMSPLRILALPLPLGYAMTAEAAMKLLIALTGMYLFCRRRYDELPAAIGAIAFAFCTFVITWLHFPIVTVAVWLPFAFLAIELLIERRTYRRFLFAVIVWTAMLYGGHPETVTHVTFFGGLFALWVAFAEGAVTRREAVRSLALTAFAIFVAALLASPFIATFAETVKKSQRFQELQIHANEEPPFSDFPSAIGTFEPNFYGHAPGEKPWGPATAESVTGFAGILGIASWFALLFRAIAQRRFRTREFFLVILALVAAGIVFNWPVISAVFHFVFRLAANARLRLFLCWIGAALTAAAIDSARRERSIHFLLGVLTTAAILLCLMLTTAFPSAAAKDSAMIAILPSVLVLVLSSLFVLQARGRHIAAMLAGGALVAELWTATDGWNPVLPADAMYPTTPLIARLQQLQDATPRNAPFRIVGIGAALFPNAQAMYGFADIRTHDPMAFGRYLGVLRLLTNLETNEYFAKWSNAETPLLNYLNVRYVVGDRGLDPGDARRYSLVYDGNDGRIFENHDVKPRFFAARDIVLEFRHDRFAQTLTEHDFSKQTVVNILPVDSDRMRSDLLSPKNDPIVQIVDAADTNFRLHIRSQRHALIVSSQPWWPGWRVSRNGQRIDPQPVNGAFLGFTIPPGDWDVRIDYFPWSFYGGLIAAITTALLMIAWPMHRRIY
ncbi:MAG TPA: YfhO family protein [Thermoanaerobaculia bacterium]|nr:YfhO family protein [Thermoanaerobaculia bacterium]